MNRMMQVHQNKVRCQPKDKGNIVGRFEQICANNLIMIMTVVTNLSLLHHYKAQLCEVVHPLWS